MALFRQRHRLAPKPFVHGRFDEHLDGDGGEAKGNHRNGYSKKSVLTGTSKMTLSVPRRTPVARPSA